MDLQFSTGCLPRFPLHSSFATARVLGLDGLQVALTPTIHGRGPARLARLVDHMLDHRPVDHGQHLLGDRLGGGQEPGAETGDGKHGFANRLHG